MVELQVPILDEKSQKKAFRQSRRRREKNVKMRVREKSTTLHKMTSSIIRESVKVKDRKGRRRRKKSREKKINQKKIIVQKKARL